MYETIEIELADNGDLGMITDFGGKICGHVGRVALALHFLRGERVTDEIALETIECACEFWEFWVAHFKRLILASGLSKEEELLGRAVTWLQRSDVLEFNRSDLFHALRTSATPDMESVEPAINAMLERNFIRRSPPEPGKPGRPAERYRVNPDLFSIPFSQKHQNTQKGGGK